jgi:outer membrane protein assembly factor BamB
VFDALNRLENIMRWLLATILLTAFCRGPGVSRLRAADWPTYLHDKARSGITQEKLALPLVSKWVYRPVVRPDPAWTQPAKEAARVRFDDAFHVVAAGGLVYFGSSGDNQVYALSADTGEVAWKYFTDGPVRLAPTVSDGRLYFGSDDGCAYCLNAESGELIWKHRAAETLEPVIGHQRIISLWPIRTSLLVDDGVAYFGAGVFPSERIYVLALDAKDGTPIWQTDDIGERGPEQQYDGISPQGYLLASDSTLYVASGRSMPAGFSREDGKFLFYLQPGGKVGGSYALLTGEHLVAGVNEQRSYDPQTGRTSQGGYAWSPAHRLIVDGNISYTLTDHQLAALDRSRYAEVAEKRKATLAEQQKLQGSLRGIYRDRYYLKDDQPDYQEQYDRLTADLETATATIAALGEKLEQIEGESYLWQRDNDCRDAMILAGGTLFVGGEDRVLAIDATTGKWLWTGSIEGRASGLAVANGRLLVSTNTGDIQCFVQGNPLENASVMTPEVYRDPYPTDAMTPIYQAAARDIASQTKVDKGFCLVLGCEEGRLALELARQTGLKIHGIDPDPEKVKKARAMIDAAGLYGHRVTIDQGSLDDLPYPNYFANLIVSDTLLKTGQLEADAGELMRVLRPSGGKIYFDQPTEADGVVSALDSKVIRDWLASASNTLEPASDEEGSGVVLMRPRLKGAGDWTHQYANPGNTANSGDQLVTSPMGVLWFGRPGPERMLERHARAAAPVCRDGRLFVQGENVVMGYDMYNGAELWNREIPGAIRARADVDGSNLAVNRHGVFVAARDEVLRLDPRTGETLARYALPDDPSGKPSRWGFVTLVGDTLFGSTAKPLEEEYGARWQNVSEDPIDNLNAYRTFNANGGMWRNMQKWPDWGREDTWKGAVTPRMITSDSLFATDIETGEIRWVYQGTIPHSIAVAGNIIYLLDNQVTADDRVTAVFERRKQNGKLTDETDDPGDYSDYDVRRVVALDLKTGKPTWQRVMDLTGCGGNKLGLSVHEGALMLFGHFSNHDGPAFSKGQLGWRRVTVVSAEDGGDMWSRELNYLRRPFVMGDQLVVEPRSVNVFTGETRERAHPVTGESVPWEFHRGGHSCGISTGSADTFFFRSYSINYYDVKKDQGMLHMGGLRAGCWINMITAGGLALMPEASAGCTCSFPIRSTVVMAPKKVDRTWGIYASPGTLAPVQHWYLNLGAPGDRKDAEGNLWFAYPRLRVGYGVEFKLNEQILPDMGIYARSHEAIPIHNTDMPWVYASGIRGLLSLKLPLLGEDDAPAKYRVRLGFCEPTHDQPGQRVFDVKLQGQTVVEDFDIAKAAGDKNTVVVQEFADVEVSGDLVVELVPKVENVTPKSAPLLNSIEVLRQ